jgi:hypothetical protein
MEALSGLMKAQLRYTRSASPYTGWVEHSGHTVLVAKW